MARLSLFTAARIGRVPRCSFCGLAQYRLVIGPEVTICESCVGICGEILACGEDAADITILRNPGTG